LLQHLKKKGFDNIYSNTIYAMMLLIDHSSRGVHFLFGSVFIKKNNQTDFFLKKKTKTGSNWPVSVRFFRAKTGLAWFFRFGSVLARFFSGLARCFRFGSVFFRFGSVFFGSGSVRFGFFGSRLKKLKPNWLAFSKF
jgi:hypothetical protein